jgi:hypothetical protein
VRLATKCEQDGFLIAFLSSIRKACVFNPSYLDTELSLLSRYHHGIAAIDIIQELLSRGIGSNDYQGELRVRLVVPTVVEPLREEWDAARVTAITLAEEGNAKGAAAELTAFHDRLCDVRVLDPACGSGNFLYAC